MDFPGEKLVIKLWETLAEKGIGSLLSPWQVGREGKARNEIRRQEILMLAQAESDACDIRSGRKQLRSDGTLLLTNSSSVTFAVPDGKVEPVLDLPRAIECGMRTAVADAARSEVNAAKAVIFAEEQLASEAQDPPERKVDEDWLFIWREHAGKVSAEDLQRLWGSVLAGEVKAPGKYSIRTLEFLKTLSKQEAELISKLASFVIDGRIARAQAGYLETHGLSFSVLLRIQELGVLSGVEATGLSTEYKAGLEGKFFLPLVSHGKVLIVEHTDPSKVLALKVFKLTEIGRQVLGLGSFEPDVEYMRLVGKSFLSQGFSVKLANWRQISETQGEYDNFEEIVADQPHTESDAPIEGATQQQGVAPLQVGVGYR